MSSKFHVIDCYDMFYKNARTLVVNYGNFMHGLMNENIQLNRKVLSELSMHEPYSFKALVDISRNAFPGNKAVAPPKKEGLAILV
ncbi:50S ribosomal L20 [Olea europaea subsp. europaea]|uniref:Large ribosomal subunit protein bL20c n=1 Tax=Olea europaea subsp. europaea TaxID=158383 RepID=A0A8S0RNU5_OLEEU|nr:50S ribosomal L20 [Olea europaea subsp. europaea]